MLSDRDILRAATLGDIDVIPWPKDEQIQPASLDLCLGNTFVSPNYKSDGTPTTWEEETVTISPGEFVLATTAETVKIGIKHVARIEGKSSFGRLGLTVHITAGFIDPGFEGQITLEMANLSKDPIELIIGDPICQLSFDRLDTPCMRPYGTPGLGSHYQGQTGAATSAFGN